MLPAGYSTQFDNVISVGATDNADQLASYSDFGATTVDIMAPGSDMFTDYPTYSGYANAYVSGTSYAAPMAAAAAALLWSADPSLSYKQVMSDIMNSAQPVPALAVECVSGGRLDVPAALADVVEPVQFSFGGFDEMSTAGVSDVVVGASAQAGALPAGTALGFHVELAYNYNGTMYDVADDPVGWSLGASGAQSATTATDGTTFISPGGMTSATFGQHPLLLVLGNPPASDPGAAPGLASGTYALVIYAATAAAPATPIGSPQAVFFNVGAASPTPSVTTTTSSAVGDSTTSGPVTTSGTGGATTSTIPWTTIGSTPIPSISQSPGTSAAATTTTGATATTAATTSTTAAATTTTAAKAATSTTAAPTTTTAAATTTTAAPTTTAATTTTTTAAATTTTTAATTTTTAATTTTSNATTTSTTASFSIDSIAPPILAATGGSVSIFGNNLPPNPAVTVGVGAAVQDATSSEIDVLVGAMTPGNYTVTVYNAGTDRVRLVAVRFDDRDGVRHHLDDQRWQRGLHHDDGQDDHHGRGYDDHGRGYYDHGGGHYDHGGGHYDHGGGHDDDGWGRDHHGGARGRRDDNDFRRHDDFALDHGGDHHDGSPGYYHDRPRRHDRAA